MKSAARQLVRGWMTSLRDAVTAWRDFWFNPADSYTLGIIRLLTGWMLVYNLLVWGIDLQAFFGVNGLQPLQTVLDFHAGTPVFSFWFHVPEPWIETAHWTCVGIAALFFLGVCTRVTSVLAFLITISYSQRVPVANFGLDQILGMLCLYLAIGPSGTCLSVDRWWKNRRARQQGVELTEPQHSSARLALRLIQVHMCVIYFWAGLAKLKGDTWFTGEAMWTVLANQEYQTMDLTWMAWVPFLPYLAAHVTVIWEMSFCVLIWNKKFRPWILLIGTGMHVGIGAFLGMWTFGLVMTYAYFAFGDPAAWRRRFGWVTTRTTPASLQVPVGFPPRPPVKSWSTATYAMTPEPNNTPLANMNFAQVEAPVEPIEQVPVAVSEIPDIDVPVATEPVAILDVPTQPPEPESQQPAPQIAAAPEPDPVAPSAPLPAKIHQPVAPGQALSTPEFCPPKINTPVIPRTKLENQIQTTADNETPEFLGNTALNPETALLLITLCKNERTTLRRYFRKHDIVCRAATTTENALVLASTIKPVAILVAGTQMHSEDLATLLEDLEDISEAPTLTLASELQASRLAVLGLSTQLLNYPVSPGEIRRTLGAMLFGGTTAPVDFNG